MDRIVLPSVGLGTIISILSLIVSSTTTAEIVMWPGDFNFISRLSKIFNLDLSKYNLVCSDKFPPDHFSDCGKMFSPYFDVKSLSLFGSKFALGKRNKPYIGLVCYSKPSEAVLFDPSLMTFPSCRYYSVAEYAKLFEMIKLSGYDVITFDNLESIENTVFMMNEMCECVIGYEGGLQHVAHVLKIPSIILPWRNSILGGVTTDRLHLDKRTFFVDSISQILAWTPEELKNMISSLYCNNGNNSMMASPDIKFASDLSSFRLYNGIDYYSYVTTLSDAEISIIRTCGDLKFNDKPILLYEA